MGSGFAVPQRRFVLPAHRFVASNVPANQIVDQFCVLTEGRVACKFDDPDVERVRRPAHLGLGACSPLGFEQLAEAGYRRVIVVAGQFGDRGGFDHEFRRVHVPQGDAAETQKIAKVPTRKLGGRPMHRRASARSALHGNEVLGLQHAEGLTKCRPRDRELFEHFGFGWQQVAFGEFAHDDLLANVRRDQGSGLRGGRCGIGEIIFELGHPTSRLSSCARTPSIDRTKRV